MKKNVLRISCLAILAGVFGVLLYMNHSDTKTTDITTQSSSQKTTNKDVREVVWRQLTAKQQAHIVWQDGKITKTTLAEGSVISNGDKLVRVDEYAGKEVYVIDFTTDSMAIPNNIIVYADIDTLTIIGYGLVD